jgi:hypothetical protein
MLSAKSIHQHARFNSFEWGTEVTSLATQWSFPQALKKRPIALALAVLVDLKDHQVEVRSVSGNQYRV